VIITYDIKRAILSALESGSVKKPDQVDAFYSK